MKDLPNRKLNRLQGFDYSQNGGYFVTICTAKCEFSLSEIVNNGVALSPIGEIVKKHWLNLEIFFNNCHLDLFVIMPNHFHGIIFIDNNLKSDKQNSLSNFIRNFKSFSSNEINKTFQNQYFKWQKSFYDIIIRDEQSLENIRTYIINNPINWSNDKYFK